MIQNNPEAFVSSGEYSSTPRTPEEKVHFPLKHISPNQRREAQGRLLVPAGYFTNSVKSPSMITMRFSASVYF
jgi:hypothetical protein